MRLICISVFYHERNARFFYFQVALTPPEKVGFICLHRRPTKIMKNGFYFILKAHFLLKIMKFLFRIF